MSLLRHLHGIFCNNFELCKNYRSWRRGAAIEVLLAANKPLAAPASIFLKIRVTTRDWHTASRCPGDRASIEPVSQCGGVSSVKTRVNARLDFFSARVTLCFARQQFNWNLSGDSLGDAQICVHASSGVCWTLACMALISTTPQFSRAGYAESSVGHEFWVAFTTKTPQSSCVLERWRVLRFVTRIVPTHPP